MFGNMTNEEYLKKVLAFHGHPAPGILLGGHMVEAARSRLPEGTLFDVVCESKQCLPDAVQILTPCTVGNGWLKVLDMSIFGLVLYDKYTGAGVRVHLDTEKLKAFPTTYEWFFKLKPKKEQDGDALRAEIIDHGPEMLTVTPVQMHADMYSGKKGKGPVAACPVCGEAYAANFGDRCPLCAGGRTWEPA